ncbi:LOW QUALITY PROTEIN: PDZ domain protein, putative [Schistosoma mansoni]|uniref:PDZ domain protein, putative n=1 Tax=Schistosoma mansoni TaxID=6183 RepID=UPI00022C8562|nr:LOW QUALITY PROTEIN: PDZ domain protein, putative [Schistosoma mansoni]|eukprot:XP_018645774.1 LOW QUALITY PROTEIN: PDZ domain protein, putative [Schistosoma mansoni]
MTTLTEATYAFISNNLQDTSKSSTVRKYELIQNEANKTTCHFIKQSLSKGPSLRKLNSTRGYFSRIRNSRNDCKNDGIQLKHIRSYTPDNNMNTFEKYSLSQDSSIPPTASQSSISSLSSSSSTRQLSPVTTPKAPLLGTNYKRNLNKNKIFRDHFESDNMLTQSTHNYCDKYGLKEQSKSREHTYHCGNTTNKLHSPPLSGLKMKAKRVWNVFERKISNNNNKGISQSKSVGNLQYTSTLSPTSENLITNHNESNVRSPHIMPSKHHIQGTYLTTVLPGSLASQAGLKVGDEILHLNGISLQSISINSINQLVRSTRQLKIAYRPRTMLAKIRFILVKKINGRVGIRLKRMAEFFHKFIETSDNTVNKEYVPLNFQDTLNQNIHTDNSNSTIPTSNVRTLNHDEVLCDYPVNDTRFDVIPLQSHTRILNSFSDYTLDCPKCFINEPQIQ